MFKLIIGLVFIFFSQRLSVTNEVVEKRNLSIDAENKEPDLGIAFDRIATRFGAFAIVAATSYPLLRSTIAVQSARDYALPGIESNPSTFTLMSIFSALMIFVTAVFGVSTFFPILPWFERKVSTAKLLFAAMLGVALSVIILLYIFVMLVVIFSSRLSPALDDVSDLLQHIHFCETNQLRGVLCERALTVCDEADVPSACNNAVKEYVNTLRPWTGSIP